MDSLEAPEATVLRFPSTAPSDRDLLDLEALRAERTRTEPFEYLVVRDFLPAARLREVSEHFPDIPSPGLYPPDELRFGPAFEALLGSVRSAVLAQLMGEKFSVELQALPLMVTVRGHCSRRDGRVHTDTASKVVTALLYLNTGWSDSGGRLRVLRSANLDDAAAEVRPDGGTLIAFRRSDRSFHGHHPFSGPRRYVMLNWMAGQAVMDRELARHRRSARIKRWVPLLRH